MIYLSGHCVKRLSGGCLLLLLACPLLVLGQETGEQAASAASMVSLSQALPTGQLETSEILLESQSPVNVVPGVPYQQVIRLTNLTDCALTEVTLYQQLQPQLSLVGSQPKVDQRQGSDVIWRLERLPPKGSTLVSAELVASEEGQFEQCLSLTWVPSACVDVQVIAPLLSVQQRLPRAVLGCESIGLTVLVTNPGSAAMRDVKVTTVLPEGLQTQQGESLHRLVVDELAPGQQLQQELALVARQTGTFEVRTIATAAGGMTRETSNQVMVRQPALKLQLEGMPRQFIGRAITYTMTVSNVGDATSDGIVLRSNLPAGTTLEETTGGGRLQQGEVTWSVPPLAAGEKHQVILSLGTTQSGMAELVAEVTADCAVPSRASASTEVFGVSAVLLELVDLQDPLEVGRAGTYLVKVTNQGNRTDSNVSIVCLLEESQTFISADGPTRARQVGQEIRFEPLPVLQPGQEVVWQVAVKAAQVGDVRFRAQLTSDSLQRPVHETEATNQY